MRSVLEAPEDLSSLKHFVGAHFVRQAATEPARPRDDYTTTIRAASEDVDIEIVDPFDRMNEVCIPTNPGTLLHPGSCASAAQLALLNLAVRRLPALFHRKTDIRFQEVYFQHEVGR